MIDRPASEVESIWQDFQLNLSVCPGCSSTAGRRQILLFPSSCWDLSRSFPPCTSRKVLTYSPSQSCTITVALFPFIAVDCLTPGCEWIGQLMTKPGSHHLKLRYNHLVITVSLRDFKM